MNLIGTRNIETERCILRRIIPTDYIAMYENWAKYDEVCKYYPFTPASDIEIYKEKVERWVSNYESGSYFHWVIEWKETGDLVGTINLGNDASSKVLKKCGMVLEGVARQRYYKNEEFIDTALWAIIASDRK